jgi:hypothetical protein
VDNDYQLPLFEWYDIQVELDRRWGYIRDGMRDALSEINQLTDDELVDRYWTYAELCPIEIYDWEPEILEAPRRSGCFDYEVRIAYSGDDELWRLRPGPLASPLPDGEIFRGRLIFCFVAQGCEEALEIVEERMAHIEPILAAQKKLIEQFDASLPDLIKAEARRLRQGEPTCSRAHILQ